MLLEIAKFGSPNFATLKPANDEIRGWDKAAPTSESLRIVVMTRIIR
jgi:hypothetical protein